MKLESFMMDFFAHKEMADQLLEELDGIARNIDPYVFGLPVSSEAVMAQMREAIAAWVFLNAGERDSG